MSVVLFFFIILLKRGAMKNREMSGKEKEEPSWLDDDANESHFSSPFFSFFSLVSFYFFFTFELEDGSPVSPNTAPLSLSKGKVEKKGRLFIYKKNRDLGYTN